MAANPLSRTETTQYVRRTLVRHFIDLDRLSITPVRDAVIVAGSLRVLKAGVSPQAAGSLLTILENELRRIHGVRRVRFELDNWERDDMDGSWTPRRM